MRRLAIGAVLLALLANAAPVQGADPATVYNRMVASSDRTATWSSLTSAEKSAFNAYMTPTTATKTTSVSTSPMILTDGGGGGYTCWKRGYVLNEYNVWGNRLFSWTLYTNWCGDGHVISDQFNRAVGETYVAFWSWRQMDKSLDWYRSPDPDRIDSYAQAEFKLCLFSNIGCADYRYPWIEMIGNATGYYNWNRGGL